MITRESIGELAEFESPEGSAVSFYFQPSAPQNKSHRDEAIVIKDAVRSAQRQAEKNGRNGFARADMERIQEMADRLHGNSGYAKAVFACSSKNYWREFDLPPRLAGTKLVISPRFHLRPLTAIADVLPRVCVALVGRTTARIFDLNMDRINEREKFVSDLPRRGRSDGFFGYDAGHAERHVDNEAMQHFKKLGERLKETVDSYDRLIIGCRDDTWPEVEPQLHTYARQKLVGRFSFDPATATVEQVKEQADRVMQEFRAHRVQDLLKEVVGEAQRNARGALGPKRVLRSLETGEVQILLLGQSFGAPAVECRNCGHVDIKVSPKCSGCGGPTREIEDVSDVLLSAAVRNGLEIVHVPPNPEFEKVGNVAALLRFRADQNTNAALQQQEAE
jgi:peptide subunit release factor 1 (eRF1)